MSGMAEKNRLENKGQTPYRPDLNFLVRCTDIFERSRFLGRASRLRRSEGVQ
jgi:hypothetical protein